MNIDNVAALAVQLQQLGFGDIGNTLLKWICFKPSSFSIVKLMDKGNDKLQVELFFEKKKDEYHLKCYDIAIPQKSSLQLQEVNGVNIASLDNQMVAINWKQAFELNEQKPWNSNPDFTDEKTIETVISDLTKLESSLEGKDVAASLKAKHWNGTNCHEVYGIIPVPKMKAEISQRFFVFDGQPGISIDEAYRFLQNRRMEKQMKSKQVDSSNNDDNASDEPTHSGSSLLKKKRINNTIRKGKHKAKAQ
jgi:hypothetical protein